MSHRVSAPLAMLACCVSLAATRATGQPIPLEDLFGAPELTRFAISPGGSHAAAIVPKDDHWNLAVVKLDPIEMSAAITSKERPILDFDWLNDELLLLSVAIDRGRKVRPVVASRNGRSVTDLGEPLSEQGYTPTEIHLEHLLPKEEDDVLVSFFLGGSGSMVASQLARFDLESGAFVVSEGLGVRVRDWWVDPRGEARVRYQQAGEVGRYALRSDSDDWTEIGPLGETDLNRSNFIPLGFESAAAPLFVVARVGRDHFALQRFDAAEKSLSEPLFKHAGRDVTGPAVVSRDGRVRGVQYLDDGWRTHWLDVEWQQRGARLERALPGANVHVVDWDDAETRFIVLAEGEQRPPVYVLYEEDPPALRPLAALHPKLAGRALVASRPVRYPARDGRIIEGYLTLPAGAPASGLPLVVLVHDGPWTAAHGIRLENGRAHTSFDAEVQFFASRGWAVFRPNYRGSTGYGFAHERAGYQRWGLEMQDDLSDGVKALIAQQVVDPKRICIYGQGYGGYAAVQGLVSTPELYRCAAAYNGVYDLVDFANDVGWFVHAEEIRRRITGDAKQLPATSPALNVAAIRAPLLLGFGDEGHSSWIWARKQFEGLRDALEPTGGGHRFVELQHSGEGLGREENRLAFYGALEGFFAEHLAGGSGSPAAPPSR